MVSPASQALSDPKDTAAEDSVFAVTVDLTSGTTLHCWRLVPGVAGQLLRQEQAKTISAAVLTPAEVAVQAPRTVFTDLP